MPDPDDWHEWLKANPPPCLQNLVALYGGYDKITPEAWSLYDEAREEWNARRLTRLNGPSAATREALAEMTARPSRRKR